MLLHAECLPAQLAETAEQTVIAATFDGCDGNPLTPGVALAKCSDIPAPQGLSIVGQTLTLSGGGGSVTLPDSDDQTLTLVGNALSISGGNTVNLPAAPGQVAQVLSIVGNTVSLSGGGGSVTVPDDQQLSIAGNVLSLTDGGSVTLPAATVAFATPAETVAGTSTTLAVNPADLYARENIPAQTGLSNNIAAIPAPAANQSHWGQNLLGETLHYSPSLGWKIVDNRYGTQSVQPAGDIATAPNTWATALSLVAPRVGRVIVTGHVNVYNSTHQTYAGGLAINGIIKSANNTIHVGPSFSTTTLGGGTSPYEPSAGNTVVTWTGDVTAGTVIEVRGITLGSSGILRESNLEYTYIN